MRSRYSRGDEVTGSADPADHSGGDVGVNPNLHICPGEDSSGDNPTCGDECDRSVPTIMTTNYVQS